ncbi:MAG: CBS domain-containing protein [Chloroflexota bacterium]
MKARDIMTKNPETATPGTTVADVARMMRDLDVGIVPVVNGDKLLGVITDRDITIRFTAEGLDPAGTSVDAFVSPNPVVVSPNDSVEKVRELMADKQIRRVLVTEGDNLVGVISIGDVAIKGKSNDTEVGEALQDISEPTDLSRN